MMAVDNSEDAWEPMRTQSQGQLVQMVRIEGVLLDLRTEVWPALGYRINEA